MAWWGPALAALRPPTPAWQDGQAFLLAEAPLSPRLARFDLVTQEPFPFDDLLQLPITLPTPGGRIGGRGQDSLILPLNGGLTHSGRGGGSAKAIATSKICTPMTCWEGLTWHRKPSPSYPSGHCTVQALLTPNRNSRHYRCMGPLLRSPNISIPDAGAICNWFSKLTSTPT